MGLIVSNLNLCQEFMAARIGVSVDGVLTIYNNKLKHDYILKLLCSVSH